MPRASRPDRSDPLTAPQRKRAWLTSPSPQKQPRSSAVTVRGDGSCAAKTALLTRGAVRAGWLPDIPSQQPLPHILTKAPWPRGLRGGVQVVPAQPSTRPCREGPDEKSGGKRDAPLTAITEPSTICKGNSTPACSWGLLWEFCTRAKMFASRRFLRYL